MFFPFPELIVTGVGGAVLFYWAYQRTMLLVKQARPQNSHADTRFQSLKRKQSSNIEENEQLRTYKTLYHKLQNLESNPDLLPHARQVLISFLSEAVLPTGEEDSILALETYSPDALERFLLAEHKHVLTQWENYIEQRASGKSSDLFTTRNEAGLWLKKLAPTKYVDGAWLGHIHKITTPFALRRVTKLAWQVLSEELGDGDLFKNHVYLYRQMLHEIGLNLPDGDSAEFVQAGGMDEIHVWKRAVAQLLISLFPNELFPEILGFNMHFEQITLDTLQAAKELPRVGISGNYFSIHVSVDNIDSGHSAMALSIVRDYMTLISETEGEAAARTAWRRIQAGYTLSKTAGNINRPNGAIGTEDPVRQLTENESRLIEILEKKARASQKIHCASRVKIGRRLLADWLSPELLGSKQMQLGLLQELSKAKPWVRRGDSEKSLLVRELSWDGKMFGAFTNSEVEVLKNWIDSIGNEASPSDLEARYWSWTGQRSDGNSCTLFKNRDIAADHPVFVVPSEPIPVDLSQSVPLAPSEAFIPYPGPKASGVHFANFLPLWFTHLCLLENVVITPFRTATPLAGSIIRLLRAEYGFAPETSVVAGMDEQPENDQYPSLLDLGLEMVRRRSDLEQPTCLKDVLAMGGDEETMNFAYAMLHWAMRPFANLGLLLGLARAFTDLEMWVAQADGLLSEKGRKALKGIVERKLQCLEEALRELRTDEVQYCSFTKGYNLAHMEIERGLEMDI